MQIDRFPGRSVLSDKLLRASGPSDFAGDVVQELGQEALEAFCYAQSCFEGTLRESGEPAICHTADVAIRVCDLSLPSCYVVSALLHDCVEDTSDTPADLVDGLNEIGERFGDEIRKDVRLLTNRYSIVVRHALRSLAAQGVKLGLNDESLNRLGAEIRMQRRLQPVEIQDALGHEYSKLASSLPGMDLGAALEINRYNRRYNLTTEVGLQVYGLFVDDMVDDSKERRTQGNRKAFYDGVLAVKSMDAIDNLRTSAATEKLKLEKILRKTQMILDKSYHLHEYLRSCAEPDGLFPLTYEMLKYTMVEQMIERKRALQNLADTRFSPLSEFMVEQISRLEAKYKIDKSPPDRLREMRDQVRDLGKVCQH